MFIIKVLLNLPEGRTASKILRKYFNQFSATDATRRYQLHVQVQNYIESNSLQTHEHTVHLYITITSNSTESVEKVKLACETMFLHAHTNNNVRILLSCTRRLLGTQNTSAMGGRILYNEN